MFSAKQLINSTKNINTDIEHDVGRSRFIWEILKVLSNKSWNDKKDMIELKKRIFSILDVDLWRLDELSVCTDFKEKCNYLLSSDEDANWIASSLRIIEWVKDTWLWKDTLKEECEDLDDFTKKSKEEFEAIAKRFTKYVDSFCSNYEKIWTDYVLKNKKIPNYKYILKKVFCNYVERCINQSVKNMKFTEEDCKEWFWTIQEWLEDKWLNLEPSDNIKQSFIKLCREKYPLAAKKNDFLFENKNFKQDFIKLITNWLDEHFEKKFDKMVEQCVDISSKNSEDSKFDKDLSDLLVLSHIVIGTISLINWIVDDCAWEDNAIGLYFKRIADQFENDHLKKLEKTSNKNTPKLPKTEFSDNEIFVPETVKTWWEVNLSERENDLIKEAVSYIDCENKKSIIKYITKLKIKGLPIKFYDFKRLFNLEEIPPKTESILIDQLWMDYEVEEEEIKAEEEISKENENKDKDETNNWISTSEKVIIEDPTQYLIDKLKAVWCVIDNELTARKQIDEFCQNDNYKTVLINLMTSPKFWKVFLRKPGHKTARILRIGRTGWRILFTKKKDGNLHFVCFGNHDYYEDCLAKLK